MAECGLRIEEEGNRLSWTDPMIPLRLVDLPRPAKVMLTAFLALLGEGYVSTFEQTDADHYKTLARVNTSAGARTSLFVPSTGRLYVAVPQRKKAEAELRIFRTVP
jgi:hypothetical protein